MEIQKNRYGHDRVIEKISHNKIRVMGESLFSRISENDNGDCIMFDFEGGPFLTVDGIFKYLKTDWVIKKISPEKPLQENLESVILEVELK